MPVEIVILSGARQGERVTLDVTQFRVGDESLCEVFFDPTQDRAIRGHAATIHREDDGWRIRNTGTGDVLVNHEPVFGNARLRSGDVVRMSEQGPDFSFTVDEHLAAVAAAAARNDAKPIRPLPSPLEMTDLTTGPPLAGSSRRKPPWGLILGLVLALIVLLGLWLIVRQVVKATPAGAMSTLARTCENTETSEEHAHASVEHGTQRRKTD